MKDKEQKEIKDNSIEDLESLLKGLKDNKETIKLINRIDELENRLNILENMLRMSNLNTTTKPDTNIPYINGNGTWITYGTTTGSTPIKLKTDTNPF